MRFDVAGLPDPTPGEPLRILVSGCIAGWRCGVDGSTNGTYPIANAILALPTVQVVPFCPEDYAFGTPRDVPNCEGGDGHDVLAGRARFVFHGGEDGTEAMIRGARRMLEVAQEGRVHLALLMDVSGACGSTVIYDGHRSRKQYRRGLGVAAALLAENGIPIVSQRDFRTLEQLRKKLDPAHVIDASAIDHEETPWFRATFPV